MRYPIEFLGMNDVVIFVDVMCIEHLRDVDGQKTIVSCKSGNEFIAKGQYRAIAAIIKAALETFEVRHDFTLIPLEESYDSIS